VVADETGLGRWPSLPRRCWRRAASPVGRRSVSTRETASPDTTAQPMPARAQQTETLCSAEKPSVPKKSRSRRSRTSPRQRIRCPSVYSVRVSALDASMPPWALMTVTDDLSRRLANRALRPSQGWERKPTSGSTEGAGEVFMVIPDMRLSPVCSARANALRGQRRTADPIPDWLRVSTQLTLHPAGAIVKTGGSWGAGYNEPTMAANCERPSVRTPCACRTHNSATGPDARCRRSAPSAWRRRTGFVGPSRIPGGRPPVLGVGGKTLSPNESEAWRQRRRYVRELLWRAADRVGCAGFGSVDASVRCRQARR
jgi:hypothetical protein